jgi:sporulation protein YlmC with PRC-barrel domain
MFDSTDTAASDSEKLDYGRRAAHVEASSLIGDNVYDASGKCLGRIEKIILDARTGCVRYVVLALGGFLRRERLAVPWHVLSPDTEHKHHIVDVALMRFTALTDGRWLQRTSANRGREIPRYSQKTQST